MRPRPAIHAAVYLTACCLIPTPGCGERTASSPQAEQPSADSPAQNGKAAPQATAPGSLVSQTADLPSEPPSLAIPDPSPAVTHPDPQPSPAEEQALSEALFDVAPTAAEPTALPAASAIASKRLQLKANLPPERLMEFLRLVDVEMQNVTTGRKQLFDVDEANAELTRLAKLKLEAAERLEEQAEPKTAPMAMALRGKLQALSHLAALGNLPAAEQLETLAWEHVESDDATVALDSQLVLLGLAMERLQNGAASDASEILGLVDRITSSRQTPDVSTLMVLGQARSVLQQYGDHQAAEKIRAVIVERFANHPNPNVGAMAIQLVGSPKYAGVDELLREFERRQSVPVEKWQAAVEALLSESADMAAVQYLASAALQFEAFGNETLADATYEILSKSDRFGQREAAEIAIAAKARATRAAIIGQPVQIDLPSVNGRPLSMESYRGKVVLMPFWAIAFPDSLTVLQTLDQIRQQFGGRVEIVGMNVDAEDAPAAEFLQQSPVAFRSFQSVSAADGSGNAIATQFGVSSLPFVVVIGPDATVAAINMTGQGLAEQVQEILQP